MNKKVFDIYLNAREFMEDTEGDWKKLYSCYQKILDDSGNDMDVDKSIQRCVLALEAKFRDGWQYTDIGFDEL